MTIHRLGPGAAIRKECLYCKAGNKFTCESSTCKLNDQSLSNLKRIKLHCLDCMGTSPQVANCKEDVLNPKPHKCHLWEFRTGHNPARKGLGGQGNTGGLERFREQKLRKAGSEDS